MSFSVIVAYLIMALLTEALTEVLVKSFIFQKVREVIFNFNVTYLTKLITCGYCSSFWLSVAVNIAAYFLSASYPSILSIVFINLLVNVLIVHRLSNMLHGSIDRYFDTRKDIRYNRN